jgi:hypothetical protein
MRLQSEKKPGTNAFASTHFLLTKNPQCAILRGNPRYRVERTYALHLKADPDDCLPAVADLLRLPNPKQ